MVMQYKSTPDSIQHMATSTTGFFSHYGREMTKLDMLTFVQGKGKQARVTALEWTWLHNATDVQNVLLYMSCCFADLCRHG